MEVSREAGHTPLGSWRWPRWPARGRAPAPQAVSQPLAQLGEAGKHRLHRPVQPGRAISLLHWASHHPQSPELNTDQQP